VELRRFRLVATILVTSVVTSCSASTPLSVSYSEEEVVGLQSQTFSTGFVVLPNKEIVLFEKGERCFNQNSSDVWNVNTRVTLTGCKDRMYWDFKLIGPNGEQIFDSPNDLIDLSSMIIDSKAWKVDKAVVRLGNYTSSVVTTGLGDVKLNDVVIARFRTIATPCNPPKFERSFGGTGVVCRKGRVIEVNLAPTSGVRKRLPRDYNFDRVVRAIRRKLGDS
jgi:hypothetical protein